MRGQESGATFGHCSVCQASFLLCGRRVGLNYGFGAEVWLGGSTMHADFFNAWDQQKLAALVDGCINAYPFSPENPKPVECNATG